MTDTLHRCDLTPHEEIDSRLSKLQGEMSEKGLDLLLLIQNVDLFYFTGTIQRGFLVVPVEGDAVFFVEKDYERAAGESPLRCVRVESLKALPKLIREHGLAGKKVGMELDILPVSLFSKIRSLFAEWEMTDISTEIKQIRSIKSDFEMRQIKRSGEIIDQVFSRVRDYLKEGMSELELDGILTSIGRAHGHQGFLRMRGINQEMMNIHVLSGQSASVNSFCDTPLAGYGSTPAVAQGSSVRRIERDQPVVIDYGGGYNGYVTDETRVFVMGQLKKDLKKAFEVAVEMIRELESFARPGVLPASIYERMQDRAAKEGLDKNFMGYGEGKVAFVGHGLGLEINEWPVISKGSRKPLEAGMVFAFEPKFVFPHEGAVGIELDYIVRENRLERVTRFPGELVSL